MKKIFSILLVALLSSAITLAAYHWLGFSKSQVQLFQSASIPSKQALYTTNAQGEIVPLNFIDASKKVMPAVVHIQSIGKNTSGKLDGFPPAQHPFGDLFEEFFKQYGQPMQPGEDQPNVMGAGSGVIINAEGYIVTNNHVIEHADELEVILSDNRTYKAEVIGKDPSTDIALLKINEKDLPFIPFSNSDVVEVGEWVLAVGNPFNLNSTVTAGIVSAKGRNINILRDRSAIESFIQTDAAINPGNSGGALVNLNGDLIGINTAIASPTGSYSGYGFAVPSNMVQKVLEDLLKFGIVQRGFLGVIIRSVDGNLAKEKSLDINYGIYIDSLAENSAAKAAGIKSGDVIVEVDGVKLKSAPELQETIARHRPGDRVSVKVLRKGDYKNIDVILFNKDGKNEIVQKEKVTTLTKLGAIFEEVDPALAKKMNIDGGVVVKEINAGKIKSNSDIQEGFIITKINNKPISDLDDLEDMMASLDDDAVLVEGYYPGDKSKKYYGLGLK